jgi:hypothetical protein
MSAGDGLHIRVRHAGHTTLPVALPVSGSPSLSHADKLLTGPGVHSVCDEQAAALSRSPSPQCQAYAVRKMGESEATLDDEDHLLFHQKASMQDSMKNSFGTEPSSKLSALTLDQHLITV